MSRPLGNHDFPLLLQQARQGSVPIIGELLESCRDTLLGAAIRIMPAMLRAKEDPADLVQSTMTRAIAKFQQFRGESREEWIHWLKRILRSIIQNRARCYREQKRDIRREESISQAQNHDSDEELLQSREPEPIEILYKWDLYYSIARGIAELTLDEKILFFHSFRFEESYEQILFRFHDNEEYVKELYSGIRHKLQRRLRKLRARQRQSDGMGSSP